MKILPVNRFFMAAGLMALLGTVSPAVADDATNSPSPVAATPEVTATVVPPMAYGVSQILQLSQAQVSDGTIVAYIKGSGNSYGLDAPEIIYLRQQGVSETVIDAMLSQPKPGTVATTVASPAPDSLPMPPPTPAPAPVAVDDPAADGAPASAVYVIPDTATYNYIANYYRPYPAYGWVGAPVVVIGGGGHWGGGYHGGAHGNAGVHYGSHSGGYAGSHH